MMLRRRAHPLAHDPPPEEVLSQAERTRAERWKHVYRLATYWHLDPAEIKRRLFVKWLIQAGRIGKGDRN